MVWEPFSTWSTCLAQGPSALARPPSCSAALSIPLLCPLAQPPLLSSLPIPLYLSHSIVVSSGTLVDNVSALFSVMTSSLLNMRLHGCITGIGTCASGYDSFNLIPCGRNVNLTMKLDRLLHSSRLKSINSVERKEPSTPYPKHETQYVESL